LALPAGLEFFPIWCAETRRRLFPGRSSPATHCQNDLPKCRKSREFPVVRCRPRIQGHHRFVATLAVDGVGLLGALATYMPLPPPPPPSMRVVSSWRRSISSIAVDCRLEVLQAAR